MRTLVAAPIASSKDYSFPAWAAATASYDRLVAVASDDAAYAEVVESYGVPALLYEGSGNIYQRDVFNGAWEALVESAAGFSHILSLETDVIPAGDVLALMEERYRGGFLAHGVPFRAVYGRKNLAHEMACTLASREDWRAALDECQRSGQKLYGFIGGRNSSRDDVDDLTTFEHLDDGIDLRR